MLIILAALLATAVLSNATWYMTYLYNRKEWWRREFALRLRLYGTLEHLLDCTYPNENAMMGIIEAFYRGRNKDTLKRRLDRAIEMRGFTPEPGRPSTIRCYIPKMTEQFLYRAFPDEELMLEVWRSFFRDRSEEEHREHLTNVLNLWPFPKQQSTGRRIINSLRPHTWRHRLRLAKLHLRRYYHTDPSLQRLLASLTRREWKREKVVSGECVSCGGIFFIPEQEWKDECPVFFCQGIEVELNIPKGRKVKRLHDYREDSVQECDACGSELCESDCQ